MRKGSPLQHNVCLLRDGEDPDAFYPRIEVEKRRPRSTSSRAAGDALNVALRRLLQQTPGRYALEGKTRGVRCPR